MSLMADVEIFYLFSLSDKKEIQVSVPVFSSFTLVVINYWYFGGHCSRRGRRRAQLGLR